MQNKLDRFEWNEKYQLGFAEIDAQHQQLFATINELVRAVNEGLAEEHLAGIIDALLEYKNLHFKTEEKYFQEFNYEEAEEHIARHAEFGLKLEELQAKNAGEKVQLAYELVDFLQEWLADHLLVVDQKYKKCFQEHGLK